MKNPRLSDTSVAPDLRRATRVRYAASASLLIALMGCSASSETVSSDAIAAGGACFVRNDKPSIRLIQSAPPPSKAERDYRFYPATAFATMQLDQIISAGSNLPTYYRQWSNHGPRSRRAPKGNVAPMVRKAVRQTYPFLFSTSLTADACTLAQTAAVLGVAGTPLLAESKRKLTLITEAPTVTPALDTCLLAKERLPAGRGVLLDFEVHDDRAEPQTERFLTEWAKIVRSTGRQTILYTNPLDTPLQVKSGLTPAVIAKIAPYFDDISLMLWQRNRQGDIRESYRNQARILGPNLNKALVVFQLSATTMADASFARDMVTSNRLRGILLWRNRIKQGGTCDAPVNRKIACLAYGRCAV